MHFFN